MPHRNLKDVAILVGYDKHDGCVYSTAIPLGDYWDGEHPWDSGAQMIELGLARVHGYLFNSDGELQQEFETRFDPQSGDLKKSWARHSDGTVQERAF